MTTYRVENMTCGHCVRTVEAAIHAVDATAVVAVDLTAGTVRVDGSVDPQRVVPAIREAGYPTSRIDDEKAVPIVGADAAHARRGCCCG